MQVVELKNGMSMFAYDSNDYFANKTLITEDCLRILASYAYGIEDDDQSDIALEYQDAKHQLMNIFDNFFDDYQQGFVCILCYNNTPVSYVIYNNINKTNSWIVEMIQTSCDYTNLGFGSKLLKQSALLLKNYAGAKEIIATINSKNNSSLAMHERFVSEHNLHCYRDYYDNRTAWHIDISNLKSKINIVSVKKDADVDKNIDTFNM